MANTAAIFTIPKSNVLRFVQTDGLRDSAGNAITYLQAPQTFDNRLMSDERWQTVENIHAYTQKFNVGDPINIQFTTNWGSSGLACKLYDINDNEITIALTLIPFYTYQDGSSLVVWNIKCDTSDLVFGLYYFKITGNPLIEFTSEMIEIGDFADLNLVQWKFSDRDGIMYDDNLLFGFRVESHINYTPTSESSIYEGFNFQPEILFAVAKRQMNFKTIPVVRYIAEKLELAFKHDLCYVNGVQQSALASATSTQIDLTNLYDFNIALIETKYEDYSNLQEISGVILVTNYLLDYDGKFFVDYNGNKFIGVN